MVIQVEVILLHHFHDGALFPFLINQAVIRPVPVEDLLQALEHPLIAPGVGGQEGDDHRVLRDFVQEVEYVPGGVSLQPDFFLALL
jgi:hypothetical protein